MRILQTATVTMLAAAVLAGCDPGGRDSSDTASTGADATTPSSSAAVTTSPGIESFDFANATWRSWSERFTLTSGTATVDDITFTLQKDADIRLEDVDGDGDRDALVPLMREQGNGYRDGIYVWLWDEQAGTATQVLPAVAESARCGDTVDAVKVTGPGEVTVTSRIRTSESGPCAETPTTKLTQVITVKDGFAWQVEPSISSLWCYRQIGRGLNFPGSDLGDDGFRAFPDPEAPIMVRGDTVQSFDTDNYQDDVPKGWTRVLFVTGDSDKGERTPCGYFPQ